MLFLYHTSIIIDDIGITDYMHKNSFFNIHIFVSCLSIKVDKKLGKNLKSES